MGGNAYKEDGQKEARRKEGGYKKIGPSKASKKKMHIARPGAKETGISLNKMFSKDKGLIEAVPEEASVIDMGLKDKNIEDTDTKDSGYRSAPAHMAFPITPPYPASRGDWACGVDYNRTEYTIGWSGAWQPPNLLGFPNIQDITIQEAYQSDEKRRCWQHSTLLDYGSYAYIRVLDESSEYSILKVAHDGDAQRQFICREFEMLKLLDTQPVVRVRKEPISDKNGLFGFHMQKLYKIKTVELAERLDELEKAIKVIHEAGIAINDVSISNVMLDVQDNITLIDFGFAGRIGEEIPSFFPPWKSRRALFSVETDNEAFNEICNLCKEGTLQIPNTPQASVNPCV
ncbi:MAG: hypothetical protein Q9217_006935 [Psora testacea]